MYGNRKAYKKSYKKATRKGKSKPKTKMPTKMQNKTVRTIVKKEIAKNIENKITPNVTASASIMTVITASPAPVDISYYIFNPYSQGLFQMSQGVDVQSRIGNRIKLKRWVIKGSVYYDPLTSYGNQSPSLAFYQGQGYINVYLGRKLNLNESVTDQLLELYQNGATTIDPIGQIVERTYSINRDEYKIYWHRRFKIGASSTFTANTLGAGMAGYINNNDYKLNHEFGFDVCKMVCKDRIIRYDDNSTTPEDALIQSLTLFATYTQPNKDVTLVGLNDGTEYSPVRMEASSYFEYEDA